MDNYQYNDKLFEILDVADSNCSSSLVESLNHLVNYAQDETYGWKKITGKYILDNKVNNKNVKIETDMLLIYIIEIYRYVSSYNSI